MVPADASSAIRLKRAYEAPGAEDGVRILVDRIWARGVSKETAHLDAWMKELGPTDDLRKWFGHKPDHWDGFVEKYRRELATPLRQTLLAEIQGISEGCTVTLIYGASDTKQNEAVALREYLLTDTPKPNSTWTASTRLLITASIVAAARHDAVAPVSSLKLFAAANLTEQEIGDALNDLSASGTLRQSADGWRVTPRGLQRMRQISRMEC